MMGRARAEESGGGPALLEAKPLVQTEVLHSSSLPNYSVGKGNHSHGLERSGGGERGGAGVGKSTWMPSVLPE